MTGKAAPPPQTQRYYARVVRPRLEVTYVEVEAASRREAETKAVAQTFKKGTKWKRLFVDGGRWAPFVELIYSEQDFMSDGSNDFQDGAAWLEMEETDFCYALLQADLFNGEGKLILQPWVHELDQATLDDLKGDWIAGVKRLKPDPLASASVAPDNIVPFERPKPTDPDEPQSA